MDEICIGTVGAGRATELHVGALKRVSGIKIRLKTLVARREEQLIPAQKRYGYEQISYDFNDILADPEIDVIDICTPPYLHEEMILKALEADKHVICEKPFVGYFGKDGDAEPIGLKVSKSDMYKNVCESIARLQEALEKSNKKFMYAENFIYAPAINKAGQIIRAKKNRILYMKGEESLKGSSSPVAGEWSKTGGGTFIRTGTHPLSAVLWLKQQEAKALQKEIFVESLIADMGTVTTSLNDYEHRHIMARPHDVEDNGTVVLAFSDGSKATIIATDSCLGGSKNYVEIYCNDANIHCQLTMNDLMKTYFLDENNLDDIPISEMLPSKIGWNNHFLSDEVIRGYNDEMQDFMEAIHYTREPIAGFKIAAETARITYAAYMAAELGQRVYFEKNIL